MPSQGERRTATRRRILDAARALLVERGADGATIAAVLDHAGVSRGAMYHHFASKGDLVAAVVEATSAEAISAAARSVPADLPPREALVAGCRAWLAEVCEPDVAAILFEAGPTVLGWERCRRIEDDNSLRLMRLSLRAAVSAGQLDVPSVDLTARVLNAALSELALVVVHGEPEVSDLAVAALVVERLVEGLIDGVGRAGR